MALTRVVVDWVVSGVGGAEMGVSREGGVTDTPTPDPASTSSVMVCPSSSPVLDLSITSLEHIVTKCRCDWVSHSEIGKIRNHKGDITAWFKPSAADVCCLLAIICPL